MSFTSKAPASVEKLTYILHHVFLPPKVPVKSDYTAQHEEFLLQSTLYSLVAFRSVALHQKGSVDAAVTMLHRMKKIHVCVADRYLIDEHALANALGELDKHGMSLGAQLP